MYVLTARWSTFARKGALRCGGCLQLWHDALHDARAIARTYDAGVDEMFALVRAYHQRTKLSGRSFPAADDDLLARAAFCLEPTAAATGVVGRVEILGDDAFEARFASRFQNSFAPRFEMLDITNWRFIRLATLLKCFAEFLLALQKRQLAQIFAV